MLVYTTAITARLQYVLQFVGEQWLGHPLEVTNERSVALAHAGLLISYSVERVRTDAFLVVPQGLLEQNDIREQDIVVDNSGEFPVFFHTSGDCSFDFFSAIFFLLSRYEEYLPHQLDEYGRYPHKNSLAFRNGFLDRPLINEWLNAISRQLHQHGELLPEGRAQTWKPRFRPLPFTFLPTYDIDIAWSYRHKGFWRNLAGGMGDLIRGRWSAVNNRIAVCMGRRPDPYDVFGWLNQLHERHSLRPYYFFLFAPRRGRFDKNIDPRKSAMQALARDHAIRYPVGIHPSWRSGDEPGLLVRERELLSAATGTEIVASRQHYIRMRMPDTYRQLPDAGIHFDFSMGYGSINGFRASVALPFYWYDLEKETSTSLMIFPFCFMEANSYFEQKQDAAAGLQEMRNYYARVKQIGGLFCMIWHNSFLTDSPPLGRLAKRIRGISAR